MAEEKKETKKTNLIYAALLLNSAGKEISEENVKKVASVVDEKIEDAQVKALVAALEGVNVDDIISKAAMPVATPAAASAVPAEEKKEEPEEDKEKKAESAAEGLSSLFG